MHTILKQSRNVPEEFPLYLLDYQVTDCQIRSDMNCPKEMLSELLQNEGLRLSDVIETYILYKAPCNEVTTSDGQIERGKCALKV